MRRYNRDQRIAGGKLQTSRTVTRIRRARELGLLRTKEITIKESQRLDHLAQAVSYTHLTLPTICSV